MSSWSSNAECDSTPGPKSSASMNTSSVRNPTFGFREFVCLLVDYKGRRVMEVVQGKTSAELEYSLKHIPGRHHVRFVVMNLCEPFRNFARSFFKHALIVADKFHVVRLLSSAINRRRIWHCSTP